jgi:hypothetical protein
VSFTVQAGRRAEAEVSRLRRQARLALPSLQARACGQPILGYLPVAARAAYVRHRSLRSRSRGREIFEAAKVPLATGRHDSAVLRVT